MHPAWRARTRIAHDQTRVVSCMSDWPFPLYIGSLFWIVFDEILRSRRPCCCERHIRPEIARANGMESLRSILSLLQLALHGRDISLRISRERWSVSSAHFHRRWQMYLRRANIYFVLTVAGLRYCYYCYWSRPSICSIRWFPVVKRRVVRLRVEVVTEREEREDSCIKSTREITRNVRHRNFIIEIF